MVHYYLSADQFLAKKKALNEVTHGADFASENVDKGWKSIEALEIIRKQQLKEVEATDEKIRNLRIKLIDDFSILKDLNSKKEKIIEVIINCDIIDTISVDDERNKELSNGLADVKRIVFLKLLKIIQDEKKTKNVYVIQINFSYLFSLLY
jgi:hypothetical protein